MSLSRGVSEILRDHVSLEIEGIDQPERDIQRAWEVQQLAA